MPTSLAVCGKCAILQKGTRQLNKACIATAQLIKKPKRFCWKHHRETHGTAFRSVRFNSSYHDLLQEKRQKGGIVLNRGSYLRNIGEMLATLSATGPRGFEGLVRRLLEELSGLRFHLARSGDQQGRDARANRPTDGSVAIECKRYQASSSLDRKSVV